jgi:hypothetical protein
MAMKVSVAARDALLTDVKTSLAGRTCRILDTVQTDPDSQVGTVLAEITLPNPAFGTVSAGSMSLSGTWQDLSINATGTAAGFRLVGATSPFYNVCGTVGTVGTDMIVDTTAFVAGQSFVITACTLTCV